MGNRSRRKKANRKYGSRMSKREGTLAGVRHYRTAGERIVDEKGEGVFLGRRGRGSGGAVESETTPGPWCEATGPWCWCGTGHLEIGGNERSEKQNINVQTKICPESLHKCESKSSDPNQQIEIGKNSK